MTPDQKMTASRAREIVAVGVMPGEIDSIDLAQAEGYLLCYDGDEMRAKDEEIRHLKSNIKQLCVDQQKQLDAKDAEIAELKAKEDVFLKLDEDVHAGYRKVVEKRIADLEAELQKERERSRALVEAASDLEDIQDHEDWCGHGKAGCLMCKVLKKILDAVAAHRRGEA